MGPRSGRGRLGRLTILLGLALVAAAAVPALASPAGAADAPAWSVSATPVTDLTDGEPVTVTIRTTADFPILSGNVQQCRAGVDYQPSNGSRPNADVAAGGPHCPRTKLSTSGDALASDPAIQSRSQTPEGSNITFRVGVGAAAWSYRGDQLTLACDADNPCALVVELLVYDVATTTARWYPTVVPISFHNDDPLAGCGGPAAGALSSGGAERLSEGWINWTKASCAVPGAHGAPSRGVFSGEGFGVEGFATGDLDLVYTAAGFDPSAAFSPEKKRASVPVPVALDATVLAVGNGYLGPTGTKVPYSDIQLTVAEVAALVGGGELGIAPFLPAIYARNPTLNGEFFSNDSAVQLAAAAEAESTTLFATTHFARNAGDVFKVPDLPAIYGADAGKPHVAGADFALAKPSYINIITLLSGRPALRKNLAYGPGFGGVWVLTDLTTARAMGLTPVSIQNAAGAFVAPTEDTLRAAIPTMKTGTDGVLLPDPAAAAPAGTPAYPLAFVDYALAPTEPLVDFTCERRTTSQALLTSWLSFITTDGQALLPEGLYPLTDQLKATARENIAKVGTAPITGACAPTTTTTEPEPTTTTTVLPTGQGGNDDSEGFGGGFDVGAPSFDAGSFDAGDVGGFDTGGPPSASAPPVESGASLDAGSVDTTDVGAGAPADGATPDGSGASAATTEEDEGGGGPPLIAGLAGGRLPGWLAFGALPLLLLVTTAAAVGTGHGPGRRPLLAPVGPSGTRLPTGSPAGAPPGPAAPGSPAAPGGGTSA